MLKGWKKRLALASLVATVIGGNAGTALADKQARQHWHSVGGTTYVCNGSHLPDLSDCDKAGAFLKKLFNLV